MKNYYLPCCRFDVHYFFSFVSSLHCIFYKSFILSNKKRFLFHIRPMNSKSTSLQIESNDIEFQLTEFIGIPFIFHLSRLSLYTSLEKAVLTDKTGQIVDVQFYAFPFFLYLIFFVSQSSIQAHFFRLQIYPWSMFSKFDGD